jgi:ferritin-like metal-binding protein YciE
MQTLHELFEHELKDIYFAEKKLAVALTKMSKHAKTLELQQAFSSHQKETEGHIKRLEKVFEHLDKKPRAAKCEGILGLIKEHDEMMKEKPSAEVSEIMHIGAGIKTERYEISAYEGLIQLAQGMADMEEIVDLLQANLREEQIALEKLHQISGGGSTTFTGEPAQLDVGMEA